MWLTEIHEAQAEISAISDELFDISAALAIAGNIRLARQLNSLATILAHQNAVRITRALSDVCGQLAKTAMESSNNMVMAALAALQVREEHDE